jgi:hypothetical protein
VAAALVALLVLIGGSVGVLSLIWLTSTRDIESRRESRVEKWFGRDDDPPGSDRDPEPPGMEEVPELALLDVHTALAAVTDAVTSAAATMDRYDTTLTLTRSRGSGPGDSRLMGPPGPDDRNDAIPRWERWLIRYSAGNVDEYARRLDFFGIELAAVGGKPLVDYGFRLAQSPPSVRQGRSRDERRLYLTWAAGGMREFDRQLLRRAGIATEQRVVLQFYPLELENTLAELESSHAIRHGHLDVKKIERTVFAVRPTSSGYEFYVLDQRYRE